MLLAIYKLIKFLIGFFKSLGKDILINS